METKSTFEQLFEDNSFFRQLVEQKIANEVAIATIEKDKQISELNIEVEKQKSLNSQVLLEIAKIKGGNANV